jgi:hypothetical protein
VANIGQPQKIWEIEPVVEPVGVPDELPETEPVELPAEEVPVEI